MDEKKLSMSICCKCGKEIDKNYARNTIGLYCKKCAFDRALEIQIKKDYESGAMDENIIFDVEEAVKNNQDAGAYVGDLLRIIHRLQSENKRSNDMLKQEQKNRETLYLEYAEQKAEIERLHKVLDEEFVSLKAVKAGENSPKAIKLLVESIGCVQKDTAKEILQYVGDLYDDGDQRFRLKDYQWHKDLCEKYGVEVE